MPASCWLEVELVADAGDWSALFEAERLADEAVLALAAHPRFAGEPPSTACVALSADAPVQALNRTYRKIDKPTNVLSFPAHDGTAVPGAPRALGDVVLAVETIMREAGEQHVPLAAHFQHLVVHGLLHLLGFDHENDEDAAEMEQLEIEILSALGIANPYSDPATQSAAQPASCAT